MRLYLRKFSKLASLLSQTDPLKNGKYKKTIFPSLSFLFHSNLSARQHCHYCHQWTDHLLRVSFLMQAGLYVLQQCPIGIFRYCRQPSHSCVSGRTQKSQWFTTSLPMLTVRVSFEGLVMLPRG